MNLLVLTSLCQDNFHIYYKVGLMQLSQIVMTYLESLKNYGATFMSHLCAR